ncbi:MAG TPA: DUF4249 domain-containing protein [Bacteroidia bacterium]|jgi:hypothetical protein|nr:DUF4249 domain-containing protein [Bacteroidia bacterium]
MQKRLYLKNVLLSLSLCLLTGCTKNIVLVVPTAPTQITVEGHVEPGKLAYLYLSTNFSFFGNISITNILKNNVIHNAVVTINDGTTIDTMKEFIPEIGYYQSVSMTGQIGKTYALDVKAIGQEAKATTTILQPIPLDSVWFQVQPNKDTLGFIWATLTSPLPPGHNYRWMAQRIGEDTTYIPPPFSVFNDQFIYGQTIKFAYQRGILPGSKAADDTNAERGYFKIGENISVKFCTIDNTAYTFYNTMYAQQANGENPFAASTPVVGNVQGGQGIWCGYGVSYKTVICK